MNVFRSVFRQFMRHHNSGWSGAVARSSPWYSGEHSSVNLRQPRTGRSEVGQRPPTLGRVPAVAVAYQE